MESKKYDLVVVGAGLVGLATAYNFLKRRPNAKVLVIDKENSVAVHQSGNNSGVIHSGIYYKPGSLKAENCIKGYHRLLEFVQKYNIPYNICGKIIVATTNEELSSLRSIYERGVSNKLAGIKMLSREEIKEYEPHCFGLQGIHVPQTGIVDYPKMALALLDIIQKEFGAQAHFNEEVVNIERSGDKVIVKSLQEEYCAHKVVCCGGLFSDRLATLSEGKHNLRIIPFRGEYFKLRQEKEHLVKNLIYPVPDPKFPFLGVHFTRMINGGVEAGPNAVLAFKREGYRFQDFSLPDTIDTFSWPGFWTIAAKYGKTGLGEIYRSLSKTAFTKALQKLIPEIEESDLTIGGAGVRAQACDRKGNLIDDFDIMHEGNIVHVRNAPSPAATSCLSIGDLISQKIN